MEGGRREPGAHLDDLSIDAPGADEVAKYVTDPTLGGVPLQRTWFTEAAWRDAGTVAAAMSPLPDTAWATTAAARPPSVADGLAAFGCGS